MDRIRPGRPLLAASVRPRLAPCWPAARSSSPCSAAIRAKANADWLDHAIDSPIITWFGSHPGLAARLAAPASPIPAGLLSAAIVVTCLLTGRLNGAVLAAAAVPVAVGLDDGLLKPLIHRTANIRGLIAKDFSR